MWNAKKVIYRPLGVLEGSGPRNTWITITTASINKIRFSLANNKKDKMTYNFYHSSLDSEKAEKNSRGIWGFITSMQQMTIPSTLRSFSVAHKAGTILLAPQCHQENLLTIHVHLSILDLHSSASHNGHQRYIYSNHLGGFGEPGPYPWCHHFLMTFY